MIIKKKNLKKKEKVNQPYRGLCRPVGPQRENQRKRKMRQVLTPCQRTKKAMEHENNGDTSCNWHAWNGP